MFNFFKAQPLSLREVEATYTRTIAMASAGDLRKRVEIVAIDDQVFYPEANLRNAGFNIITKTDIQHIPEVAPYPIILCDVNGIGTHLNPDGQGAYVIQEIKTNYPEKIVIAYTAGGLNQTIVRQAKLMSDGYLRKDDSIDDWRNLLDSQIKIVLNPIETWKSLRIRLLQKEIELEDLMALEQAVLKNVKSGGEITKEAVKNVLGGQVSSSPWKAEVVRFIASKSFDLAFSFA
ncbi:hypothetical protein [Alcaligenes phenolicus]|uniref:hypothetical protein n=1 Tax=Alcaligenes phenolicus TaxID=232846 RepID=UPI002AA6FD7E|nr:hypothetical protein [Alcaligenes phenolicus]